MKKLVRCVLGGLVLLVASIAHAADYVVIVHKANVNPIDKAFVVKAYTGDTKTWPDGGPLMLIDQSEDSLVRVEFSKDALGRSVAQMKALWAQNVFSGRALPPKIVDGDAEVKKGVAANKNAIGYIKSSSVDDSVKVVAK